MQALDGWVTQEMNDSLLRDFQPEEVAIALQQMHPIKSLRPDGMPPIFYKKF